MSTQKCKKEFSIHFYIKWFLFGVDIRSLRFFVNLSVKSPLGLSKERVKSRGTLMSHKNYRFWSLPGFYFLLLYIRGRSHTCIYLKFQLRRATEIFKLKNSQKSLFFRFWKNWWKALTQDIASHIRIQDNNLFLYCIPHIWLLY